MAHCGGFEVSSKYQREIEEILQKAGDIGGGGGRKPRSASSDRGIGFFRLVSMYVRQSLGGRFWSISPGRVMLLGFVLLLSALLIIPLVGGRAGLLGWAGLIVFIIGYGMVLVRPPKVQKKWRGELIEDDDSWLDKIRRKINRQ